MCQCGWQRWEQERVWFNETRKYEDEDKAEIYLAGGCFWGTEHFLKQIRGVEQTEVGYANSQVPNPTYKEVCTGNTGAVETVKVVYDRERSTWIYC